MSRGASSILLAVRICCLDVITQVKNTFDTTTISQYNYTNDELGRRTDRIDTMATATTNTFAYNTRSELTNAVMGTDDFAFDYDPIGNRRCSSRSVSGISTTNNYTANSMNQYSSINGTNLTYDGKGNMLTHNDWTYTWNGENRLVKTESVSSVPDEFKVCVENVYDYAGRRVKKTVSTDYSGGDYTTTNVTTFIYNGWLPIAEMCDAGYTNYYVYGLDLSETLELDRGVGALLAMTRVSSSGTNTYFYSHDGNGNVVQLIDESGTLVAEYEYSPFGERIKATGNMADENPFRFSSRYYDQETGLIMYPERSYHPGIGRWLSRDRIAEEALYIFLNNDPINFIDPDGLKGKKPPKFTPPSPATWAKCLGKSFMDKIGNAYDKAWQKAALKGNVRRYCQGSCSDDKELDKLISGWTKKLSLGKQLIDLAKCVGVPTSSKWPDLVTSQTFTSSKSVSVDDAAVNFQTKLKIKFILKDHKGNKIAEKSKDRDFNKKWAKEKHLNLWQTCDCLCR